MVAGLANFAASKGADAARLLVGAGIDGALLDDPDNRVSVSAYAALMRAAQRACADPGLALHYGEAVDMSDVSIVGLIMNASENMGEAFLQLNRFGRLALETENASADPRFALIERDGSLWLVDNRIDPNAFPEITETAFARLTCGPRSFLAAKLGFSRQTLFRRLRAEETSYEDVLDALRHRMAELYLRSGKASVNETAYLVGFSDPASFSRAFKRWTGKTPSEVRGRGRS